MKEILLISSDLVALVDDEYYDFLSGFRWRVRKVRNTFYAYTTDGGCRQLMHRIVIGAERGCQVDHIDGNGLNNCRNNLRIVSNRENSYNQRKKVSGKSTSNYKGVCFWKNRWWAKVVCGSSRVCGSFLEERDAALFYDMHARRLFG